MKIKEGFITRKIGDAYYAVSFDSSSAVGNGMVKLSDSAYFIWRMLEEGADEAQILSAMKENFRADEETLRRDISAFVARLSELGVLE